MRDLIAASYVVLADADQATRATRLTARSPDMSEAERHVRLEEAEGSVLAIIMAHKIIDTNRLGIEEAQLALRATVDRLVE